MDFMHRESFYSIADDLETDNFDTNKESAHIGRNCKRGSF
jgi:hypothetical protein